VDTSLSGYRVARVLDRIATTRPLPVIIVSDNGPELTSKVHCARAAVAAKTNSTSMPMRADRRAPRIRAPLRT
jgi:hypothetical protein